MTPEDRALLKDLLTNQRVLALSVVVDGEPVNGLLPFAVQPDYTAVLIHASQLARHTAGLDPTAAVSLLIHVPDEPAADPLQLPRVSLRGRVQPLSKGSPEYDAARDIYVAKFPASEPIFELGDFNLYQLNLQNGRLVVAFGRAYNLDHDTLRLLAD